MTKTLHRYSYQVFTFTFCILLSSITLGNETHTPQILEPLDCVINPSMVADLGSSVPGVLSTVFVDRSDFVEAGDIVAKLESGINTAALELARTKAALTAEIDLRRTNAAFGKRQYQRIEDLFSKNVISSKDMDQTQTETKLTQIQLRQAMDNQKLARLELVRAKEVLARHSIKSPITGVIMERFKTMGEYVDDQPIVRVAQLSPLHVEVIIPVEQLGRIRQGMIADVSSESVNGKWQAKVSRIDRVADVASGTFGVRLILENPDYKIPAGLRCRINFLHQETPAATSAIAEQKTASESEQLTALDISAVSNGQGKKDTKKHRSRMPSIETRIAGNSVETDHCSWLGPYINEAAAITAASTLNTQNLTTTVEHDTTNEQVGFKVLSPLFDSKSQARAYLKRLRKAGDKDHFLLPSKHGEPLQVSLGLYAGPESAKQRVTQLKKKGFIVITQPRFKQNKQYWLSIKDQQSRLIPEDLKQLKNTSQSIKLTSCNQQASL